MFTVFMLQMMGAAQQRARLLEPQTAQLLFLLVFCSAIWDRTTAIQFQCTPMRQPSRKYSKIFRDYIHQRPPIFGKGGTPCKVQTGPGGTTDSTSAIFTCTLFRALGSYDSNTVLVYTNAAAFPKIFENIPRLYSSTTPYIWQG